MGQSAPRRWAIPLSALIIGFLAAGCGPRSQTPWPDYTSEIQGPPQAASQTMAPAEAAAQARSIAGRALYNVKFSPSQAEALKKSFGPVISSLESAMGSQWTLTYQPSNPFNPRPNNLSWTLIGKVLSWRIQDELLSQQGDQAVRDFLTGTKLGFMLCSGDARDASCGDQIADEVRKALMVNISSLGAGQLESLSGSLTQILNGRASRQAAVLNEHRQLLQDLQSVQDLYAKGDMNELASNLGDRAQPAITTLDSLQGQSRDRQIEFFSHLHQSEENQFAWLTANAALPKSKRASPPEFDSTRSTSWKSAAASLFTESNSWLQIDDVTLARTRLLVIYSELLSQVKAKKSLPKSLSGFSEAVRTDPFTGRTFFYVPQGTDFLVYSAGENGVDDGSATDAAYSTPDLLLERSR